MRELQDEVAQEEGMLCRGLKPTFSGFLGFCADEQVITERGKADGPVAHFERKNLLWLSDDAYFYKRAAG